MEKKFDAIIIGSGQAGNPLAKSFAENDWKVAVIEKNHVGGSCINFGCTPSKTLAASARAAYVSRNTSKYGVHTSSVKINLKEVYKRKKKTVESFRKGSLKILEHKNITLIKGDASFVDSKTIEIKLSNKKNSKNKTEVISSDKIFINTGGRPAIPKIKGLDDISYLTSTSIMELKKLPEHLLIIGGGYIGLEFGQMFKRFGSKVTILQNSNQLLKREDKDVADEVLNILEDEGIKIYLNTKINEVSKSKKSKKIVINFETPKGNKKVKGSHLLIATGHTPNTDDLNLSSAKIKTDDKGYIITNTKLETNIKGIFALGDVKGGPAFTHISYDDFRIVKNNILNKNNNTITGRMVPYVIFIDPQLGRIGMNEKEAKEKKINYSIAKMEMSKSARAIEISETRGFMKVIVDKKTDKILGCTILGFEGGEIMSMLQIAIMGKLKYSSLKNAIFAHPTFAESLNNLFNNI